MYRNILRPIFGWVGICEVGTVKRPTNFAVLLSVNIYVRQPEGLETLRKHIWSRFLRFIRLRIVSMSNIFCPLAMFFEKLTYHWFHVQVWFFVALQQVFGSTMSKCFARAKARQGPLQHCVNVWLILFANKAPKLFSLHIAIRIFQGEQVLETLNNIFKGVVDPTQTSIFPARIGWHKRRENWIPLEQRWTLKAKDHRMWWPCFQQLNNILKIILWSLNDQYIFLDV